MTDSKKQIALQSKVILPNMMAGLVAGVVALPYCVSYASLIFSGELSNNLSIGIGSALVCTIVSALIAAFSSSFAFPVIGPDANSSVILSLITSAIAIKLNPPEMRAQLFPTAWAAVILGAIITGIFLFLLGKLRLGRWVRFIPYPVIGGFLAGSGWLLVRGSFKVMAGVQLSWSTIPELLEIETFAHWLLGLGFALLLLVVLNRYKHFAILPSFVFGASGLFLLGLRLANLSLEEATAQKWLFDPFPREQLTKIWDVSLLSDVNWSVLLSESGNFVVLILVALITILLNASSLEIATQTDVNLDRELQVCGSTNLLGGFLGGMVGVLSFNRSLLGLKAGASNPLALLTMAAFCSTVFFFGSAILTYIPKPILGGLLLYLGLALLVEWVYKGWFKLPRTDYLIVLLIWVVIAASDFLKGVGVGILVAAILFVLKYSRISVAKRAFSAETRRSNVQRSPRQEQLLRDKSSQIYIVELQNFIFFGTANTLLEQLHQRIHDAQQPQLQFIILDFRLVNGVDSSAALSFVKLRQTAEKKQIYLIFTGLGAAVKTLLKQGNIFSSNNNFCLVFADLDRGLEWCETQILKAESYEETKILRLEEQLSDLFGAPQSVSKFINYLEPLQLSQGNFLFRQGELANGLYFLESGQVSVLLELADGQTKRLRTFNGGTILGEMGLYAKVPRSASIIADQCSSLYFLSLDAFHRMETEAPANAIAFHKFVVSLLAERLNNREEELKSLL